MTTPCSLPRAAAACASLLLALCANLHAQPIPVGFIAPLTGDSSDFGNSARLGAELAVNEINQVGGFLGRPIELRVKDDKADPAVGAKLSEELVVRERVAFTIGFCNTGVAMQSLDVFRKHKHLLMVPCAQGSAITRQAPPAENYVFRVAPPDALNARFLITEIVERHKLRQVAIFADRSDYGEGGLKQLTAELLTRGLQPVYVARISDDTRLVESMRAAKQAGANAIVTYAVGKDQVAAVKASQLAGLTAPYFAPWTLSSSGVLNQAGASALEGTAMVQTIIQDGLNERRSSFIARYFKLSKEAHIGSLMAAAQSYDAVHLMVRALFQTKGVTSGDVLKKALEHLEQPYRGVVTTYDRPFSPDDHEAIGIGMLWLGVWKDGKIAHLHADDAKRAGYLRSKQAGS